MKFDKTKMLCKCVHEFQDAEYGKNIRVVTPVNKSRNPVTKKLQEYRCTSCGNILRD